MKATIDIPDDLYRRVKARTAQEGRRIREVTVGLYLQWLDESATTQVTTAIPVVNPAELRRHRDAASLHQAYPRGYRLTGPLLPAAKNAPVIPATLVDQALADMDTEELTANARPR